MSSKKYILCEITPLFRGNLCKLLKSAYALDALDALLMPCLLFSEIMYLHQKGIKGINFYKSILFSKEI